MCAINYAALSILRSSFSNGQILNTPWPLCGIGRVYDTPHAGTGNAKSKAWLLLQTVESEEHPVGVGHSFLPVVGTFGLVLDVLLGQELELGRLGHIDSSGEIGYFLSPAAQRVAIRNGEFTRQRMPLGACGTFRN
jgi:hypothetical protein